MRVQKDEMIRVLVARRTKATLQEMAQKQCRPLSNLCLFVLEQDRMGDLRLANGEGTLTAASAPVSPDPRSARINIRCERQLKKDLQRQAAIAGKTLSAYCSHLFERFTAAELGRVTSPGSEPLAEGGGVTSQNAKAYPLGTFRAGGGRADLRPTLARGNPSVQVRKAARREGAPIPRAAVTRKKPPT